MGGEAANIVFAAIVEQYPLRSFGPPPPQAGEATFILCGRLRLPPFTGEVPAKPGMGVKAAYSVCAVLSGQCPLRLLRKTPPPQNRGGEWRPRKNHLTPLAPRL